MGYYKYLYPNAASKYKTYSDALENLKNYKRELNNYLNKIPNFNSSNYTDSGLAGDYYNDVYTKKVDEWISDANKLVKSFDSFKTSLDSRISDTQKKVDLYKKQKDQKEWVEA